jgi:hypothetical protein
MNWPQYIIDQLGREPIVGDWYCVCCIHDFGQIKNAEDLEDVRQSAMDEFEEDGWQSYSFWATEYPARAELEDEDRAARVWNSRDAL